MPTLAELLAQLKAENRQPTAAESKFINDEIAKGMDVRNRIQQPNGPVAPPAPASVRDFVSQRSAPSVLDSPVENIRRKLWTGVGWALDVNPTDAVNLIKSGLKQGGSEIVQPALTAGALVDLSPGGEINSHLQLPSANAVNKVVRGGMTLGLPALGASAVEAPFATALGLGTGLAGSAGAQRGAAALGATPDQQELAANVGGLAAGFAGGVPGHMLDTSVFPQAPAGPWHNIDLAQFAKDAAASPNGISRDPFTSQDPMHAAVNALGRGATEMTTPAAPGVGELAEFLDRGKVRSALQQPGRVLGTWKGADGNFVTEVSQGHNGPQAARNAMREAIFTPKPQEAIFVRGASEDTHQFPSVPRPLTPDATSALTPLPGASFIDRINEAFQNFGRNEVGAVDPNVFVPGDLKVTKQAKGGYKAINPNSGSEVFVRQKPETEGTNVADRSNIVVQSVPPEWESALAKVGINQGDTIEGTHFRNVFEPSTKGELSLTPAASQRANTLYDLGKTLNAEWTGNTHLLKTAEDIAAPGVDPREMAARLFGSLSPKVGLGENLTRHLQVLNRAKMLGKNPANYTPADWKNITQDILNNRGSKIPNLQRAFKGQPLSSYSGDTFSSVGKTEHLAQLMAANKGEPFDIHNMRGLNLRSDAQPQNAVSYELMYRALANEAAKRGLTSAEFMHPRWSAMRSLLGIKESPGPEQLLRAAGITDIPGTKAFQRYLDYEVPWNLEGELPQGTVVPPAEPMPIAIKTTDPLTQAFNEAQPPRRVQPVSEEMPVLNQRIPDSQLSPEIKDVLAQAKLSPQQRQVRGIMDAVRQSTQGVYNDDDYAAIEHMISQPIAKFAQPETAFATEDATSNAKFVLPDGTVVMGPAGVYHTKFAGPFGAFNQVMRAGAVRTTFDNRDIGLGIEAHTPITTRAAEALRTMHENQSFLVNRENPEGVASLVDVHEPPAVGSDLRYNYSKQLGFRELVNPTAKSIQDFAHGLFEKARAEAAKKK